MDETLKIRLLKAIGHDAAMHAVLLDLMDRTQAEYCAFCAARDRERMYILCENRELSRRVPEIREKLRASYRMFTNGLDGESESLEKIFYRKESSSVEFLLGDPRIESYFLVPLAFGSKVRGVLFFGSVRKEAFSRGDIAAFRSLAEEGEERTPLLFRVGGEREILELLLEALPLGAALLSPDGAIAASNDAFDETLGIHDEPPDSVHDISRLSPFSLQGIWDEFIVLQRNVLDRELKSAGTTERYLSISLVKVQALAEEVSSLLLLRNVTAVREQAEMREEMIAMVAHELRTPLTALKNSLTIYAESSARKDAAVPCDGSPRRAAAEPHPRGISPQRFLGNALRTVERLGMLVDGLIDSSPARIDDRPLRIERHDVKAFVEEASSLFLEPFHRKGIDFRVFVDAEASRLAFDRDRLEQVVQNLLANSIKHVPSGGALSITIVPCAGCPAHLVPRAVLERIGRLSFADLCVRDTGAGIPDEVARRMNEGAGAAYRPVRGAKGLGLHVAQRLMRLHGGSLVIEEGIAGGSAVHLYLPADEASARVVQQYRATEMRLEELLSRGLTPVVHFMQNVSRDPWELVVGRMRGDAVINPARGEPAEHDLFVWPLDPAFAIGMAPREGRVPDPDTEGLRIGSAVARRDGMNLRELVVAAARTMTDDIAARALKGDSG